MRMASGVVWTTEHLDVSVGFKGAIRGRQRRCWRSSIYYGLIQTGTGSIMPKSDLVDTLKSLTGGAQQHGISSRRNQQINYDHHAAFLTHTACQCTTSRGGQVSTDLHRPPSTSITSHLYNMGIAFLPLSLPPRQVSPMHRQLARVSQSISPTRSNVRTTLAQLESHPSPSAPAPPRRLAL